MKLKKIASLMLAGIMAVSMLAGCNGKGGNDENKDDQNQVVAASVADYANSLLNDKQKNVFDFENSSELTAALQKVAGDSTKFTSKEIKEVYDTIKTSLTVADNDVIKGLKSDLDLDIVNGNDPKMTLDKKGTKTGGWVYQVSGKLTEASAVQLIVKNFANGMMNDGTDTFPAYENHLKADYSAEISAVKVTAPDNSGNSAWVVAIVVTQTAVEVSNAG